MKIEPHVNAHIAALEKELAAKNYELQIEASLEKVRVVAMSMKEPADMLNICKAISLQLQSLDVKEIRNVQTAIFYESKNTYMNYEYYAKHDKTFITETCYTDHKIAKAFAKKMLLGRGEFSFTYIKGKKVKEWLAYQKTTNVFIDEYLNTASSLNYYWFSLGPVALGISTYAPLKEEDISLFKRFLKVFELSYTRYLDIEQAIAQTRESQIQLALERVRARTMAMQKSDELKDAAALLFRQVKSLGVPAYSCGYNIWEENETAFTSWMSTQDGSDFNAVLDIPLTEDANFISYVESKQKVEQFFVLELRGERMQQHYQYLKTIPAFKAWFDYAASAGFDLPETQIHQVANFSHGNLLFITLEPCPEFHNVFKRFAAVFEQTYTRFLDLQKAEAQARESQIQLALERVRARTMAMQKSDELPQAANLLFEQIQSLGMPAWSAGYCIWDKNKKGITLWMSSEGVLQPPFNAPLTDDPPFIHMREAHDRGETFYVEEVGGKELIKHYEYMRTLPVVGEILDSIIEAGHPLPTFQIFHLAYFSQGFLLFITYEPVPESHDIFKRFAKVFDQTYTRFLDLQKAEAQAKEAEVQLALERVRARTMAMQKHEDLLGVLGLLVEQLIKLGVQLEVANFSNGIPDEDWDLWIEVVRGDGTSVNNYVHFPRIDHPYFHQVEKNIKTFKSTGKDLFKDVFSKEDKDLWQEYVYTQTIYKDITTEKDWEYLYDKPGYAWSMILLKDTWVSICKYNNIPFSDEEDALFRRFVNAFGQAYTRFLDLQKAETQAREAQIEAALEKVRARAMAMQKPNELIEVARLLRKEMGLLGVEELETSSIYIHDEPTGKTECWYAIMKEDKQEKKLVSDHMTIDLKETWVGKEMIAFYRSGKKQISIRMKGVERKEWINYCADHSKVLEDFYGDNIPDRTYHLYKFSGGYMGAASPGNISVESWNLLQRATSVFSLAYTRFSDLQQAEAQAREAQIEAALERVRARTMAMQNSNDLSIAASVVFTELRKLGIQPIRCGVGILNKESRKAQLYSATSSADGDSLSLIGWVELSGHPVLKKIYDTWMKNEEYFPELTGGQLKSYYELLLEGLAVKVPEGQGEEKQYGTFLPFTIGCLYAWFDHRQSESEIKILKRFATIIDLTFRRYLELQKSEANAKEAIKQAALDRIRADIASMRTTKDLERITPLIWNELNVLGVPFIRCGVFIMDDEQQLIHTFLSTPDGKAIAAFHIPYGTSGNIKHVTNHWRNNRNYIDHWDENAFTEFAEMLVAQKALTSSEQYLQTIPHGGFHLHFLPFLQGMLYVGNTTRLGEDQISLIQSLSDAFSTAYARYEDFNKLEAAKKQVDKTLVELKQTQQQLIQSEKMASLGELTAGIAHEIQNPLNFVNNFSEVSIELADELKEEMDKMNMSETEKENIKSIIRDLVQNQEKINQHGKRADAIVKGMLQHSRASTGKKELTDINVLCNEYLRLAYHGLRAKDKTFNALIETDFDKTIKKINVIPQDIGRVLLNLFNNAFYSLTQRKKELNNAYEPTIYVCIKKSENNIEIYVKDNGNGVPQKVLDKIFQPFFTTKPSGEGTGLGLSLSYDIIKAHGGEIKVETKENEGAEFVIRLPLE